MAGPLRRRPRVDWPLDPAHVSDVKRFATSDVLPGSASWYCSHERRAVDTAEALESDGVPVHLDIREGLGHVPPPDLDQVIRDGLAWIGTNSDPRDSRTGP